MRGAGTCQPLSPACPETDPHSSGAHAMTHDPFEELDPVVDPAFVFDFEALDEPDDASQRWSTWLSVEPLSRGPEPRPDWVVTHQGALDTELGILQTGKEAEVQLIDSAAPGRPGLGSAATRPTPPQSQHGSKTG